MFLSGLRQKLQKKRRKEIPLSLLSRLWIENKMREESLKHPPVPFWRNSDINQFYAAYVGPNTAAIGVSGPIIVHILTLLEDKGDCFCRSHDPENEKNISGMSLREHSLCVARLAVDMIKKAHRDYEVILGKILIICLGHRLGILSSAAAIGGVSDRSLLLLHPLIQDLAFKDDIVTAIRTFEDNHPKTDEAKILKAAALGATKHLKDRSKVLSGMDGQQIPDIDKIRAAIFSTERNEK